MKENEEKKEDLASFNFLWKKHKHESCAVFLNFFKRIGAAVPPDRAAEQLYKEVGHVSNCFNMFQFS